MQGMRNRWLACGAVALAAAAAAAAQQQGAFEWFAASDGVRVFEDGYACPAPRGAVDVFGIRGEVVSAQCVVAAREPLGNVTVRLGPLEHAGGAGALPPQALAWNFVGCVPIPRNTPYVVKSRLARTAPARFPDFLSEVRAVQLKSGQYQAVWLTFRIPPDAAPGAYNGTATIETDHGSASLPLRLTVYPLRMPDRRHLNVTLWFGTRRFADFHGAGEPYSDRFWTILKAYADAIADHRQNIFRVDFSAIEIRQDDGGRLSFDFSRFDRWADIFWGTGKMDWLESGFLAGFGEGGFYSRDIVLRDLKATRNGKEVVIKGEEGAPQLLRAFERHLEEKGWLSKTLLHVADEPTNWNVRAWREVSHRIHEWAPSLRRMDAIEATGFDGELEVWVPKLNHLGTWFETYKKAQARGAELWYYSAMPLGNYPNRYIDYPLIETRIMHWLNYRFGITGFLHWGGNSWTANPYEVALDEKYGAADGWIAYPKRDGLVPSVRWEAMRAGLQDYEYLWMLEDRTASLKRQLGPAFDWIEPAQRGIELASRVIRGFGDYTRDPGAVYAVKEQALREILEFDRPPRLYVQTTPRDGTGLIYAPARIEVRGWTEPGTEITIAGKKVPVAADGYFADAPQYSPQENILLIRAAGPGGEKIVRRSFPVVP